MDRVNHEIATEDEVEIYDVIKYYFGNPAEWSSTSFPPFSPPSSPPSQVPSPFLYDMFKTQEQLHHAIGLFGKVASGKYSSTYNVELQNIIDAFG